MVCQCLHLMLEAIVQQQLSPEQLSPPFSAWRECLPPHHCQQRGPSAPPSVPLNFPLPLSILLTMSIFYCFHKSLAQVLWLKQCNFMTLQFCRSDVWHRSHRAKIGVLARLHFIVEESVFLSFLASRGHLHSLACDAFIHVRSQEQKVESSCPILLAPSSATLTL